MAGGRGKVNECWLCKQLVRALLPSDKRKRGVVVAQHPFGDIHTGFTVFLPPFPFTITLSLVATGCLLSRQPGVLGFELIQSGL